MSPIDRDRLRHIVAARLESLRLAGVLQLPRLEAIGTTVDLAPIAQPPTQIANTEVPSIVAGATLPAAEATTNRVLPTAASVPPLTTQSHEVAGASSSPPMAKKKSSWDPKPTTLFEAPRERQSAADSGITLEVLQQRVAGCTRCNELAATRTQTVFGVGNPKARLCFLGEAPGADEDKQGEPFVGRGGQLLNKIIEACRLKREEIYILNMLKCRPPNNRNPLPHELANCREYLEAQLDLIRPEFICCLGAVASQNLLVTTVSIGKLRGKIHDYRGAKVVCTYHPAFLLRSPSFKKETWEDMKMLMREMGVVL